jgi:hypothetical protein
MLEFYLRMLLVNLLKDVPLEVVYGCVVYSFDLLGLDDLLP